MTQQHQQHQQQHQQPIPSWTLLEIERDRLARSTQHLERSVGELKAAIAETGPDPDYRAAIDENLVLIAKQRARVAALEEEIRRARGQLGDVSAAQLAAVPAGAGTDCGGGHGGGRSSSSQEGGGSSHEQQQQPPTQQQGQQQQQEEAEGMWL